MVKLINKHDNFIKRNKISLIKRRRVYDVKQTLAGRQPSFVSQILCLLHVVVGDKKKKINKKKKKKNISMTGVTCCDSLPVMVCDSQPVMGHDGSHAKKKKKKKIEVQN